LIAGPVAGRIFFSQPQKKVRGTIAEEECRVI
jgi:hypothetical protein